MSSIGVSEASVTSEGEWSPSCSFAHFAPSDCNVLTKNGLFIESKILIVLGCNFSAITTFATSLAKTSRLAWFFSASFVDSQPNLLSILSSKLIRLFASVKATPSWP